MAAKDILVILCICSIKTSCTKLKFCIFVLRNDLNKCLRIKIFPNQGIDINYHSINCQLFIVLLMLIQANTQ